MATALAEALSTTEIELTVLDNMRLALYPQEIARAGEHNSAIFRIVQQPQGLDALPCRAEIQTGDGAKFYVLVQNGTFALTDDITKHGTGTMQLVYSDATVSHKTQLAQYWVAQSIFAIDPSDPQYQDGLAQIVGAAFTGAGTLGTQLIFTNIAGREVARVTFPGAGLDEAQANQLYLRLDGTTNAMQGSIIINGTQRGVVFDPPGNASAIYSSAGVLLLRRPVGGEVQIEENNGQNRSTVVTQFTGDQRYLTQTAAAATYATVSYVDGRFLSIDGGQIVGPIRQLAADPPATVETLVTRGYVEGAYLPLSGGTLSGTVGMAPNQRLISAMGTGGAPMLCVGSNDSGFWRSSSTLILEMGFQVTALFSPAGNTFYGPLALPGPPTQPNQAATKAYVDQQRATSFKFDIPVDFPLSATWQNLYTTAYQIPRGGLSRVRVSLSASLRAATAGGLSIVGISCQPEIAIDRIERQLFVYNLNGTTNGFTVEFYVDVNGAAPVLTLQASALATNPANNDITILGGDTFNIQRSQILIEDLGAR